MVTLVLVGLAGVVLTLMAGAVGWALASIVSRGEAMEEVTHQVGGEDLELRITRMEQKVELLPQTWEAFRNGALKAEQRARHHARKAARGAGEEQEELEELDGVRGVDEQGSGGERMLALRNGMGVGAQVDAENELLKLAARVKGLY